LRLDYPPLVSQYALSPQFKIAREQDSPWTRPIASTGNEMIHHQKDIPSLSAQQDGTQDSYLLLHFVHRQSTHQPNPLPPKRSLASLCVPFPSV
jgi:hypothetical protein